MIANMIGTQIPWAVFQRTLPASYLSYSKETLGLSKKHGNRTLMESSQEVSTEADGPGTLRDSCDATALYMFLKIGLLGLRS